MAEQSLSRRKFLTYTGLGVAGLAATGAAAKIVSDQLATQNEASGDGGSGVPTEIRNTKCLWGAYVDPGTGSAIGAVEGFEQMIGRRLDLTRHYIRWDRKLVNGPIEQSAKAGRIPLIAWHTQRLDGSWVRWRDIAKGQARQGDRGAGHAPARLGRGGVLRLQPRARERPGWKGARLRRRIRPRPSHVRETTASIGCATSRR
jgi:hypothetical protein